MVISFPKRFPKNTNIQDMFKFKDLITSSSFQEGFFKNQYDASLEIIFSKLNRASSWPEAIWYLLKRCTQSSRISSVIDDLPAMLREMLETEIELTTRLYSAIRRCCHIYLSKEILTLSTNTLHPTIRSAYAQYKTFHCRASYLDVVDFVRLKKDAVRARNTTSQLSRIEKPLK